MCHGLLGGTSYWRLLNRIDDDQAERARLAGCPCGGVLHRADYPRKPRGVSRSVLGTDYESRRSFCCAVDGCRRRRTPPSVRFLGAKVYLGAIVIVLTALEHGLTGRRRRYLIDVLDVWPQTLSRWRRWWREDFVATPLWQQLKLHLLASLDEAHSRLPGVLLGRLAGIDLCERVVRLLRLLAPLTTASCAGSTTEVVNPQSL